jgi:hypothetical protein
MHGRAGASVVAVAVLLVATAGCRVAPLAPGPRPALAPEAPPEAYYEVPGAPPAPLSEAVEAREAGWDVLRVALPARVPDALASVPRAKDPIDVLWYRPRGAAAARPLVLISPVLGNSRLLVGYFAERFAARGWHAAIVFRKEVDFDPETSLEGAEDEMRLLVMRSRQALDWLLEHPDVDRARLGTFGVSAGAVVSSLLAGTDARLCAHVLYLGGGPLADVMCDSTEDRFERWGEAVRSRRGLSREEVRAILRRTIRTDPLLVAPRVRPEDALLVVAGRDTSVPTRCGLALWEAMGRPEMVVTPLGHRTTFVLLPWLGTLAADFFARRFGDPETLPETRTGGGPSPPPVVR